MMGKRTLRPPLILWLWAVSLPWGILTQGPVFFMPLPPLMAGLAVLWALGEISTRRTLLTPFELAWPPMCAAALALLPGGMSPAKAFGLAAVFLATVHLCRGRTAPGGTVRGTQWTLPLLHTLGLSGGVWAAFNLAAWQHGGLVPTAHSFAVFPSFYGPPNLGTGITAGGAALIGAVSLGAGGRSLQARIAGALAAAALVPVLGAVLTGAAARLGEWVPPPQMTWHSGSAFCGFLLAAWLFCRIAAKLLVRRPAAGVQGRVHFLGILGVLACQALLTRLEIEAWHAVLLGISAATALPPTRRMPLDSPWPHWRLAVAGFLIPLVLYNARHVDPANLRDPRNYAAAAGKDMQAERWDDWDRRLAFYDAHWPQERMTHVLRARGALELGAFRQAAEAYVAAQRRLPQGAPAVLPPPSASELDSLFAHLRQAFSGRKDPPPHLAYERALVVRGDIEGALELLAAHTPPAAGSIPPLTSRQLARAVAFLLEAPTACKAFSEWPAAGLMGILERCGGAVEEAGGPYLDSPWVFAAYTAPGTLHYAALHEEEDRSAAGACAAIVRGAPAEEGQPALAWTQGQDPQGGRSINLTDAHSVLVRGAPPEEDGAPWTLEATGRTGPIPPSTAVLILLPQGEETADARDG